MTPRLLGGKLIFHIFGALAEFERNLIKERTTAGLIAARARGRKGGRPKALTAKQRSIAQELYEKHHPIAEICRALNISRATLYRLSRLRKDPNNSESGYQLQAIPPRVNSHFGKILKKEVSMRSWDALPNVPLRVAGPVTAEFMARGITSFQAAGRYLQALPYGRTANRTDFSAVLHEGRGTCSTKHALLATLAHEQQLPVVLTLGIYEMNEENTPGVGVVLAHYGLASLPEAHCYLTYNGARVDVTRSGVDPTEPITRFLHEEAIVPEQIGAYKVTLHHQYLQEWLRNNPETLKGRGFEGIWQIREECIAALTQ